MSAVSAPSFRGELEQQAFLIASTLEDVLSDAFYFENTEELEDFAQVIEAELDIRNLQLFRPDGSLMVDTQQGDYPTGMVVESSLKAVESREVVLSPRPGLLEVTAPIVVGKEVLGGARFELGTDRLQAEIRSITTQRIWQAVVMLGLGVAVSVSMARYFVRPIRGLVSATEKIGEGELEFSPESGRSDEIGDLALAFNEMTGKLGAARAGLEERTAELGAANEQLHMEVAERICAEGALRGAHDELEARVEERTVQLSSAVDQLLVEIAERERADGRVKASLGEKEVLLKEVHHRVKNNLQIISSLLDLQTGSSPHEQTLRLVKESQNRIRAMALIHEQLYESEDLARIDFGEYVRDLSTNLFRAYEVGPDSVALKVDCEDVRLSLDKAIPCGLVINELVTNALKYAFPERQPGEIAVGLRSHGDDEVTLRVADNGVGLPDDSEPESAESLGLKLVAALADQLGGTLELDRTRGIEFRITFKADETEHEAA